MAVLTQRRRNAVIVGGMNRKSSPEDTVLVNTVFRLVSSSLLLASEQMSRAGCSSTQLEQQMRSLDLAARLVLLWPLTQNIERSVADDR
jgi:hypothetical protein